MRPKIFTVVGSTGGVTVSRAFIVDNGTTPANIAVGVVVSGNVTIADVQHTFADVGSIDANSAVSAVAWLNNATLVSANAANQNGMMNATYDFAPTAIRLLVRALASAGAGERATMTVIQAGPR